jgi:hypothetical protein
MYVQDCRDGTSERLGGFRACAEAYALLLSRRAGPLRFGWCGAVVVLVRRCTAARVVPVIISLTPRPCAS